MNNENGQTTSAEDGWTISSQSDFTPIPEGMHECVVTKVGQPYVDEDKWSDTPGATKTFFRVSYGTSDLTTDGGEPMTITKRYTKSLHPKSSFYKDLIAILGRPLTAEEARGFSPASIEGEACKIIVEHSPRNDGQGIWANVAKVMKAAA